MQGEALLDLFRQFPSVSTDTRSVKPGDLFFALRGDRFDGNQFAAQALEQGAARAIVDQLDCCPPGDGRYIFVNDSLVALQRLASAWRQSFRIPVVGLTGSNGKTTSKELIASVLSVRFRTHATRGNLNNHIGVPLTLLAMPADTEIAIVEMGTNQPGDIAELAAIAQPTHSIITNVGYAHIENLGSLDGVRREKGAIFDYIRACGGLIFRNEADPNTALAGQGHPQAVTYGTETSDFFHRVLESRLDQMDVEIHARHWAQPERFRSQLSGAHNAMNVLLAAAVGTRFGLSPDEIREGIWRYAPVSNRSQLIRRGPYAVWMDAYNANPSSMRAAIEHVASLHPQGLALVLGDMLELGPQGPALHAEIGRLARSLRPHVLIGVGPLMQHAVAEAGPDAHWFPDAAAAREALPGLLGGASVVLFKGSRGMALERLLEVLPA
ncbi:MAG: UDP-N-acetylmuramoyl-tripeptide--D-alanyl-D-alanine ligase [Bacteroidia bacterium]|nr:UDP-N-acetylmuramoyl-tripeptide--D-alanyl-D-alanine ligase [Bacteroidia bacterium]